MKILIKNTENQKSYNCEAEVKLCSKNKAWGFYSLELLGFGTNEWSASMNLVQQIDELITELQKLKENVA